MTNARSTKRALLASVMALLLCFTMLLGTTFAWFTDTATASVNDIQSGTLDIVLEYHDETEWKDAEGQTLNFKTANNRADIIWEPGCTYVLPTIRVRNNGDLALKYEIAITGVTGDAKLLEVIDFTVNDKPLDIIKGELKTKGAMSDELVIKGHMSETANNDYQNKKLTGISITVYATQLAYESDSINDQYDANAEYPIQYDYIVSSLDELKNAFAKGGNVLLKDNITFEKITTIEPGADVYLNMNGKTITVNEDTKSNTLIWVKDGAKLTIDGNGTFDLGNVTTMALFAPYGELVIENGNFIRNKFTTVTDDTTGLFMGCKITSSNVTINGGYFDSGYYNENAAGIEDILAGTATLTETADDIAKRGNSKDANPVRVALKDNVSALLNHSGYGQFKVYGGTFVGANPAWGDEGCMLPTTPNYLRPWSYYQGGLLDGQVFNENELVIPDGYTITESKTNDGRPVYTVTYNK